jgi:tRNA modification GTPase
MNLIKLKDYNMNDTIAAIATFPATSALGVIKISGRKALSVASEIFLPKNKKNIKKAKTYTLHYGWIVDKSTDPPKMVDEVLVSVMRAPASYTKEDVIEISSHGGAVVLNKLLNIVLGKGARLAQPGEFTYRALINGRIDLLQAQSILDIVEAKSEETLTIAGKQLRGEVSQKLKKLKNDLTEIFCHTEASINFPEDQAVLLTSSLRQKLKRIEKTVGILLAASQEARIFQEGLRCVICGRTNVGKSTLFNCLLRDERVIVSHIAGTTRDVVQESINVRGIPLRIYDTAGVLEPQDLITKKAIEKTAKAFDDADIVIAVLDGSRPLNKDDIFILNKLRKAVFLPQASYSATAKKVILVINKSDMPSRLNLDKNMQLLGPCVTISALHNKGIKTLETALTKTVLKTEIKRQDYIFLNQQQRNILAALQSSLIQANQSLAGNYPVDFVHLSLKQMLEDIGMITGEVASQEVLESIFSRFCIGK